VSRTFEITRVIKLCIVCLNYCSEHKHRYRTPKQEKHSSLACQTIENGGCVRTWNLLLYYGDLVLENLLFHPGFLLWALLVVPRLLSDYNQPPLHPKIHFYPVFTLDASTQNFLYHFLQWIFYYIKIFKAFVNTCEPSYWASHVDLRPLF
jgi:hypothetical protein